MIFIASCKMALGIGCRILDGPHLLLLSGTCLAAGRLRHYRWWRKLHLAHPPKATPPTTKPSWAVVINAFPQKYQLQRDGCRLYHARTIIQRLGLRTWCAHLVDKISMCQNEFPWAAGVDFVRDQGGLPGVPAYWLTLSAARQIYDRFAM